MLFNRGKQPEPFQWTTTVWWYSTDTNTPPPVELEAEAEIRRIVRDELADIMPIEVPDAPPEDLR